MNIIYNSESNNKNKSSEVGGRFVGEVKNFPNLMVFEGNAKPKTIFNFRMQASILAMAELLDYIDQTVSYKYYPYGDQLKAALYYDCHKDLHKKIVLQLASHSHFFEQETEYERTVFQEKDTVRVSLNELDLWPIQFEILYESFIKPSYPFLHKAPSQPKYRRIEVLNIISLYDLEVKVLKLNNENEWSHLWMLIKEQYSN